MADGTRTVLFSTHITSDLEKCATHITYIQGGEILCSAEKSAFIAAFDHLRQEGETLTLEEIMVRTERRGYDESAIV